MLDVAPTDLHALPLRPGPAPRTSAAPPHEQLSQNAPVAWQEQLYRRVLTLPGVTERPSQVSVPGTRAFFLAPGAAGPGGEFAHLHPARDGSLHLWLPPDQEARVFAQGWGEAHPLARRRPAARRLLMVYGPRDAAELDAVWQIVRAAHRFAGGVPAGGQGG